MTIGTTEMRGREVPTVYGELIEQLREHPLDLCKSAAAVIERLEFRALGYAGRIANLADRLDRYEKALRRIMLPGDSVRARGIANRAINDDAE